VLQKREADCGTWRGAARPSRDVDENYWMNMDSPGLVTGATVTAVARPLGPDSGPVMEPETLLVLPLHEDEDGIGVYPEETLTLVKRLRADGVSARYLHPPELRRFEGRKGVIADAAYTVVLGVLSSAAWDGVKRLLGRSRKQLKVTFGQVDGPEGDTARWWHVEGDSADTLTAIDKLMAGTASQQPVNQAPPADDAGELRAHGETGDGDGQQQAGWFAIPDGSSSDLVAEPTKQRREDYLAEAAALREQASGLLGTDRDEAERCARAALYAVVRAFWWAEELPEEDSIHESMHELGRWVRETFGCTILPRNGVYEQRCPVDIAHKKMGMSIGFTAQRLCSLCGEDISECPHVFGTAYLVPGGVGPSGRCPVCLSDTCTEHDPAQTYRVSAVSIVAHADVQEISLVGRPRQPEARFLSIPLPTDDLREYLGPDFVVGMPLSCDKCLSGCWGFTTLDPPDSSGLSG
jgi:hypothetical protein